MSDVYLTIDLGTSALKAVLYDPSFQALFKSVRETRTLHPRPTWAEQDPRDWWQSTVSTVREVLSKAKERGVSSEQIKCVGCCAQSCGITLVDEYCIPLQNSIIWPDLRAIEQGRKIKEGTGIDVHPMYSTAKLLWTKENRPGIFDNTYKILQPKDFIRTKFTKDFCTDVTDAAYGWLDKRLTEFVGIPPEKLPEVYPSEKIVGEVTEEAARETGVPAGTPVIAGSGNGSWKPIIHALRPEDSLLVYLGTAPGLRALSKRGDSRGAISGVMSASGGALLKWFKEQFGDAEERLSEKLGRSAYELLDQEASRVPPGSEGVLFLPHMMGERSPLNPNARGVIYGLTLAHRREHIYRAILEGITYHLRAIWESVKKEDPNMEKARHLLIFGGGSKSPLWRIIIANVFGLPVEILGQEETATLNLAAHISVALGAYPDVLSAFQQMKMVCETVADPTPELTEKYAEYYANFRRIDKILFQHETYLYRRHEISG